MKLPWASRLRREDTLLERARTGNRDAFVQLYRSLYPPLWRFVARRTPRAEDAEDVLARVFEKLLSRLDRVDTSRGHVRVFLYAVARNELVDAARTQRQALELEEAEPLLLEPRTPLETLLDGEQAKALRGEVAALPADARQLLALRYGDGLGHREISALLGLSPTAVRQRLSRALRGLRQSTRLDTGALAHDA